MPKKDPQSRAYHEELRQIKQMVRKKVRDGTIVLRTSDPEAEVEAATLKLFKELHPPKK
jgi:hypothetical protein